MNTTGDTKKYAPLRPELMMQLAAPHTWPAAIFPVLVAVALAMASGGTEAHGFSLWGVGLEAAPASGMMACVLLAISVMLQSAVNTINDYFDYVKGTDTVKNQADPTDAVLVYNKVNPGHVLAFALVLIGAAFALGSYVVWVAGWIPLVIALVGVVVIFLYSGGRTPISYLPVGELASGFTMGGLIALASYQALTLRFDWLVLLLALPVIMAIALIMATNNTCDVDKDREAQRRTLPVLLGHERAVKLYRGLVFVWIASTCALVLVFFTRGWVVLPFMLLAVHPLGRALLANPLTSQARGLAFGQVTSMNVAMGTFYAAAIFASAI